MSKHVHVIGLGISTVGVALDKQSNIVFRIKNSKVQLDVTKKIKDQKYDPANDGEEETYLVFPNLDQGLACLKAFFIHLENVDQMVEDIRVAAEKLKNPE